MLHRDIAVRNDRLVPLLDLHSPPPRVDIGLMLLFVAHHLAVELVRQQINGGVHVCVFGFGV